MATFVIKPKLNYWDFHIIAESGELQVEMKRFELLITSTYIINCRFAAILTEW